MTQTTIELGMMSLVRDRSNYSSSTGTSGSTSTSTSTSVSGGLDGASEEVTSLRDALLKANRSLEWLKKANRKAKEAGVDTKQQLQEAQEEIEQLTARAEKAERDRDQYRNWWFNEVQFTKLILNKVPNRHDDWELVRSSQRHYLGY